MYTFLNAPRRHTVLQLKENKLIVGDDFIYTIWNTGGNAARSKPCLIITNGMD